MPKFFSRPCSICLDLDPSVYEGFPKFQRRVQLYQLRAAGKDGCISCLVLHNAVMTEMRHVRDDYDWNLLGQPGNSRGWVSINVRPGGYVPKITWPLSLGFELFSQSETGCSPPTPLGALAGTLRVPSTNTLERALSFVQPLLDKCDSIHNSSCRPIALTPPRRLLDLGESCSQRGFADGYIKLIDTENALASPFIDASSGWKYIALSHCWGQSHPIKTNRSNLAQHHHAIAWADLGKTFQDAIQLTRALGIRYLWVDSLCIIQDDLDDWQTEAANMTSVYSESYLTISATGSKDGGGGCLFSRPLPKEEVVAVNFLPGCGCRMYVRSHRDLDGHFHLIQELITDMSTAPLLTRAWCFQERILSPRVLHFLADEMVWECRTTESCECGWFDEITSVFKRFSRRQITEVLDEGSSTIPKTQIYNAWLHVVDKYSSLHLTHESDRLPALAGLARRFSEVLEVPECHYLAGHWEEDILRSLPWASVAGKLKIRHKTPGIPSWSWVSMAHQGVITTLAGWHEQATIDKQLEIISVLSSGDSADHSSPLMRVSAELRLKMRGICVMINLREQTSTELRDKRFEIYLDLRVEREDTVSETACLLLIGSRSRPNDNRPSPWGLSRFLVLLSDSCDEDELKRFKRIGYGETTANDPAGDKLFENGEIIELVLV
ncbi:heterokaryon incompatibility protein-domain-containing protein [Podospora australis]|uniref:Heterokaryon incompatibility protein-domain-containing protein n=1 Tax=Podospora australis TaxID=1536484 RepID=A0AAN6WJI1_9PEZI|nr:heterokaryon incompatibility protein-domain-containing protein [Podospora australis]